MIHQGCDKFHSNKKTLLSSTFTKQSKGCGIFKSTATRWNCKIQVYNVTQNLVFFNEMEPSHNWSIILLKGSIHSNPLYTKVKFCYLKVSKLIIKDRITFVDIGSNAFLFYLFRSELCKKFFRTIAWRWTLYVLIFFNAIH